MMKLSYKHMIEQVILSEHAQGKILNDLSNPIPEKKCIKASSIALIAACLCLLLMGTVFAVDMVLGFKIFNITRDGYTVEMEGIVSWPQETFGQEMATDLRKVAASGGNTSSFVFNNWDELEEYTGLTLANNAILNAYAENSTFSDESCQFKGSTLSDEETEPSYRYRLILCNDGTGVISSGDIFYTGMVEEVSFRAHIEFYGEINGESNPSHSITTNYEAEGELFPQYTFTPATYSLRDGTLVQLIYVDSDTQHSCRVLFVWEGNLYDLYFYNLELATKQITLQKVLDAF